MKLIFFGLNVKDNVVLLIFGLYDILDGLIQIHDNGNSVTYFSLLINCCNLGTHLYDEL